MGPMVWKYILSVHLVFMEGGECKTVPLAAQKNEVFHRDFSSKYDQTSSFFQFLSSALFLFH